MKGRGLEVVAGTASGEGRKEQRWPKVVVLSWTSRPLSQLFQREKVRVLAHSSCEKLHVQFLAYMVHQTLAFVPLLLKNLLKMFLVPLYLLCCTKGLSPILWGNL